MKSLFDDSILKLMNKQVDNLLNRDSMIYVQMHTTHFLNTARVSIIFLNFLIGHSFRGCLCKAFVLNGSYGDLF